MFFQFSVDRVFLKGYRGSENFGFVTDPTPARSLFIGSLESFLSKLRVRRLVEKALESGPRVDSLPHSASKTYVSPRNM